MGNNQSAMTGTDTQSRPLGQVIPLSFSEPTVAPATSVDQACPSSEGSFSVRFYGGEASVTFTYDQYSDSIARQQIRSMLFK